MHINLKPCDPISFLFIFIDNNIKATCVINRSWSNCINGIFED